MKIDYKIENDIFNLYFDGEINSTNSQEVEEKINEALKENKDNLDIIFDVEKLTYISSAGLRIVLKEYKAHPTLKIINANVEVYDIFDMTGFTKIMNISKAYKQYDVSNCKIIGEGAKGIVYRYNNDTIIKVYKELDVLDEITKERELSKKAFVLGLPTAISFDVCKVGNKYGSVFELLDCDSLSQVIKDNPQNVVSYAKRYALLLKQIHETLVDTTDMTNSKYVIYVWLEKCEPFFKKETFKKLKQMVDDIPDNNTLVHGDYHTHNVMVQNDEFILIDMDTLGYGNPIIDLANVDFSYKTVLEVEPDNLQKFLGLTNNVGNTLYEVFLETYFETKDEKILQEKGLKIDLLSYLRIIYHFTKRNKFLDEVQEIIKKVETLVQNIDSLII